MREHRERLSLLNDLASRLDLYPRRGGFPWTVYHLWLSARNILRFNELISFAQ